MATSRRGAFRASLSPFGGGKLNLDDAYRVAEFSEPVAAPEPVEAAPAAAVAPTRPGVKKVVKPKAAKKVAKPIVKKPIVKKPVAKRIPPPPRKPIITGAKKAARGIGAARRTSPMVKRPIPRPPGRGALL